MNDTFVQRILSIFLAVMLLLSSMLPAASASEYLSLSQSPSAASLSTDPVPEESVPGESFSEESVPEESIPEESVPEESIPEESVPEDSIPEESVPEEPVPEESVPEESVPEESIPEESVPEESVPEESVPEESVPEESVPEESVPEESVPEESVPEESRVVMQSPMFTSGPRLYFGQLHAHTELSIGTGTVEDAFRYAAQVPGLDFLAITDRSDSFDHQVLGQIHVDGSTVSADWAAGKAAAQAATSETFVGIFGYEMGWPRNMQIGHIGTFNTPGFQSWEQDDYNTYDGALERYYEALGSVPGAIGQFNHPGTDHGTFNNFGSWSETADRVMTLLEVGSGGQDAYQYYTKALDLGWHVAPTNNQANSHGGWGDADTGRTVVYANSLTETGIYDALRECRAYATEDADLEILYSMDGYFMGSRLDRRQIGETADLTIVLFDPNDEAVGLVEVITNGGAVVDSKTLSAPRGTVLFSLPSDPGYYYLRITQPDGDIAVTAPIWIDAEEQLGISGFFCETDVPIQGEPVSLTLELYNQESSDFIIETLEVFADGEPVAALSGTDCIPANSRLSQDLCLSFDCVGLTNVSVKIQGTLDGGPRTYETSLLISFRQSPQVTGILIDGSHGNAGLEDLSILRSLAARAHIRTEILTEEADIQQLKSCRFLLIGPPSTPFSPEFLNATAEFAAWGGNLILYGQGDRLDESIHSAAELNRLLQAIGSTVRMGDDLVQDAVNNGGLPEQVYPTALNLDSDLCRGLSAGQVFRHVSGCTVDPGSGTWLLQGFDTTSSLDGDGDGLGGVPAGSAVLMACEELRGGGLVLAAGCHFLEDAAMAEPRNMWDIPYANRTIGLNLLELGGEALPLSSIQSAREAVPGTLVRIRGYVTVGTSNPYNQFPETLYLQDDTGGIAAVPFLEEGIQTGTPMEFTGIILSRNGNVILKPISWEVLAYSMYQYQPLRGSWKTLLDPAVNGSRLVEVEGECVEIYCREDHTLAGCLLKDEKGNLAVILVEDQIGDSSDGENDLHWRIRKGRKVRAAGLLYLDDYGDPVIRVRNCEEVVYVPPRRIWNPNTGDHLLPRAGTAMITSLAALMYLKKKKIP